MELIDGSKYKIKKTRETLYAVMSEHFRVSEKLVVSKLKQCGFKNFNSADWERYVECLTGHPACPYCSAPMQYDYSIVQHKIFGSLVCVQNKAHYHMQVTEDLIAYRKLTTAFKRAHETPYFHVVEMDVKKKGTQEEIDMIAVIRKDARTSIMKECIHGDLQHACEICIQNKVLKNLEEA